MIDEKDVTQIVTSLKERGVFVECEDCAKIKDINAERYREQEARFTRIETKINCLLGILSAIGVAVLSIAVKLLFKE